MPGSRNIDPRLLLRSISMPSLGGQSGAVVTRPHGYDQNVGSNPAAAK